MAFGMHADCMPGRWVGVLAIAHLFNGFPFSGQVRWRPARLVSPGRILEAAADAALEAALEAAVATLAAVEAALEAASTEEGTALAGTLAA